MPNDVSWCSTPQTNPKSVRQFCGPNPFWTHQKGNAFWIPKVTMDLEDHFDGGSDHGDYKFCDFHSSPAPNHLFFLKHFHPSIIQSHCFKTASHLRSLLDGAASTVRRGAGGQILWYIESTKICKRRISKTTTIHDITRSFLRRVRDGHTRQRAAVSKSTISNLSHRLWDGQTSQRGAASKSKIWKSESQTPAFSNSSKSCSKHKHNLQSESQTLGWSN